MVLRLLRFRRLRGAAAGAFPGPLIGAGSNALSGLYSRPSGRHDTPSLSPRDLARLIEEHAAMSDDRIPMTREGYDKLKAELDRRYQEHLAEPREGSSWDEVKRRVLDSK